MGNYAITLTGKLNKSCMEKHTILIGKVSRLYEKNWMVCITGERPVPFTDKPYKTLVSQNTSYLLFYIECW